MALIVRRAAEPDLDAVGRITVEAYRDDGFIGVDDDYVEELADAGRRHREAEVWVAVEDGEVVGSVTFCTPGTPFAELARDNEGEFRMLGVARNARRRGVAEALVVRCIERSRELGYDALVLCSMRQMSTAHRLYERLGFRRLPERDWSPAAGIELLGFVLPLR
jgi:ribosomal protein S18 acetylase RimI-like enzyme